jgi:hypothetical protein
MLAEAEIRFLPFYINVYPILIPNHDHDHDVYRHDVCVCVRFHELVFESLPNQHLKGRGFKPLNLNLVLPFFLK